jgi:hypothetical protein
MSPVLSVCLFFWRPWFSMSLRRLDSADQWQSYQSGPVPGTLGPLLRGFRLAASGRQSRPWGLDIGLKHRIRAFPRRTRSQSRHITRRRYNLQTHVHVPCTAAHTEAGAQGGDGWRGWEGCGSSDHRWPWAVIPGLAQHPQAAGQTHTNL